MSRKRSHAGRSLPEETDTKRDAAESFLLIDHCLSTILPIINVTQDNKSIYFFTGSDRLSLRSIVRRRWFVPSPSPFLPAPSPSRGPRTFSQYARHWQIIIIAVFALIKLSNGRLCLVDVIFDKLPSPLALFTFSVKIMIGRACPRHNYCNNVGELSETEIPSM